MPRAIRIPDDLWDAALRRAQDQGTTVSEVVRERLGCNVDPGDYFSTGPRGARYGLCAQCCRQGAWVMAQ